jgi:membrane-associated protease RseP (regulator of RpoE activity)
MRDKRSIVALTGGTSDGVTDERRARGPAGSLVPPHPASQPGYLRRQPGLPAAVHARPAAVGIWPVSKPLAATAGRPGRPWLVPVGVVIIFGGVGGGVLADGLPAGSTGMIMVGLLIVAAGCWAVGLSVQLESARLVATATAADLSLVDQITHAHQFARNGMRDARRALQALRGDEIPGPASILHLVSETSSALSIPITLQVEGTPGPLAPEAGLTAYRTVQEALTNVAKHAGAGAVVSVLLSRRTSRARAGEAGEIESSSGNSRLRLLPSRALPLWPIVCP